MFVDVGGSEGSPWQSVVHGPLNRASSQCSLPRHINNRSTPLSLVVTIDLRPISFRISLFRAHSNRFLVIDKATQRPHT